MTQKDWFTDDFSRSIWETKYRGSSLSIWNYFNRLASLVADGNENLKNDFLHLMWTKKFSPGGRILAWAGRPDASLSLMNCTTHAIAGDSLEDISDTVYTIMRASSRGQGIGIDISSLRPAGAPVNNAAKTSTGSISFMEMLNAVGGTIGQEGRRAALLFSIDVRHPDLYRQYDASLPGGLPYDFLNLKRVPGRVENANISVRISDQFMKAVVNDGMWEMVYSGDTGGNRFSVGNEVPARELFMVLASAAHKSAEPGVLFWDTSRRMSNSDLFGFPIVGVNACSEQVLDQDGVCNLGSMNLAAYVKHPYTQYASFDIPSFRRDVKKAIEFLDMVVDIELREDRSITETQRRSLEYLRRTGLGVMGMADMMAAMELPYGTDGVVDKCLREVFEALRDSAYEASIDLAKRKGMAKAWELESPDSDIVDYGFFGTLPEHLKDEIRKYGTRNITLLSIAPTGTISNLFGVTSGIEPLFARSYVRRTVMRGFEEHIEYVHPGLVQARDAGYYPEPELLWRTAYEVSPIEHLQVQALVQEYIDQSISKTLNFPASATPEDVADAYLMAWYMGLKGLAVYVDGSRQVQTLYTAETNDDACPVCDGDVIRKDGCEECSSCGWSKCSL